MGPDGDIQLNAPRTGRAPARAPSGVPSLRGARERVVVIALAMTAGIAVLFSPVKLCLVATVFRMPCPGCGMTRATFALLSGDVGRAFAIHPLSPVIAPLVMSLLATEALVYVRTGVGFGTARIPRTLEVLGAGLVVLLVGVWLARFFGCFGGPVSIGV